MVLEEVPYVSFLNIFTAIELMKKHGPGIDLELHSITKL